MGRFEAPVDFYRYREPYPQTFFDTVAAELALNSGTRMLDVGCGPGILAIGFAPFVGRSTAIDPEPAMLSAARAAAAHAHVEIEFIQTNLENFDCPNGSFDFVTIGRALHWLAQDTATAVLDRIVAPAGRIAITGSSPVDASPHHWTAKFKQVRKAWASEPDEKRYHIDLIDWFSRTRFHQLAEIVLKHRHTVTVDELVWRAFSFSTTSIAVVGERRPEFEKAVRTAVEPFARGGVLEEEVRAIATVFG